MIATSAPFSQYFDKSGDPLDSGYVYFGVPDANPETSPIPAFWDEAGTQPVAQPARTLAGYIVRNGTPARVYVEGAYSQTVKNKKGELVYYAANSEDYSNLPVNVATIEATAGQTNVNLPFSYTRGNNSLAVYLNGSLLLKDRDYIETSETAIQMLNPLKIGPGGADEVTAIGGRLINPSSAVGTVSAAALAAGSGAGLVGYDYALTFPSGTVGEKLKEFVSVKDFGAVGDGVTDDLAAITAAMTAGVGPIFFPPGLYCVSGEVVVPDGTGIVGSSAFWARRTAYVYDPNQQTILKYIGAGGANTCVVRLSEKAVGVQATDTTGPETDDLVNIVCRDFHIDCDGLADIGLYMYRAGNQATVGNITAEKAVSYNHVHLGCFAAEFGTFGAYRGENQGVCVGYNIFGWTAGEATCFAYRARYLTATNGTAGTYVPGTATDLDGSGGLFSVGRGSEIFITSESNDGRACILTQPIVGGATGGPTDYVLEYLEGNGDGPYVDYRNGFDAIRLTNGFIHPGNGTTLLPQDITIEAKTDAGTVTTDAGPTRMEEWLVLHRLFGDLLGVGPAIKSNTFKYRMMECGHYFTFTNKRPGAYQVEMTLIGAITPGSNTYVPGQRSGFFTRIGNLVYCSGRIRLSALDGAMAGGVSIGTLPYRVSNLTGNFGTVPIGTWSGMIGTTMSLHGQLSAGATTIPLIIQKAVGAANATQALATDLTSNTLLQFSFSYLTDES